MERTDEPAKPHASACPWCPYTDVVFTKVLTHMEAQHPRQWGVLALSPLVAGKVL